MFLYQTYNQVFPISTARFSHTMPSVPHKHAHACDDSDETTPNYHQTSNISHIKSKNLNVSCLVLQLSLLNPLKPGVKSSMKM